MTREGYKRIGIIAVAIACTTLAWGVAHAWLVGPRPFSDVGAMILPAIMLAVSAGVAGLAFVLLASPLDRLAIILASWATFIVFWTPDVWYISVLPFFSLAWYEASRRTQNDLHDRMKIRIGATLGRGVKLILLGIFLMMSLGFYLLPANRQTGVEAISRSVQGALESAYDVSVVEQQLNQLPPALQSQFRRDVADSADQLIRDWLGPLGPAIPPILAFGLFLALWSLSIIFREAAIWLGTGIFLLLKRFHFIRITEEGRKAELLSL